MKSNEKNLWEKEDEVTQIEGTEMAMTDLKAENIIYGLLDAILVNWGKTE